MDKGSCDGGGHIILQKAKLPHGLDEKTLTAAVRLIDDWDDGANSITDLAISLYNLFKEGGLGSATEKGDQRGMKP